MCVDKKSTRNVGSLFFAMARGKKSNSIVREIFENKNFRVSFHFDHRSRWFLIRLHGEGIHIYLLRIKILNIWQAHYGSRFILFIYFFFFIIIVELRIISLPFRDLLIQRPTFQLCRDTYIKSTCWFRFRTRAVNVFICQRLPHEYLYNTIIFIDI